MEQTRALNALAPFLALSKSAKSPRAAADLITQATSAINTYVFAELLHTEAIQAIRGDAQYGSHYTLLEIFAWGTWADYQGVQCYSPTITASTDRLPASAGSLPQLSDTQTHKLRLLTLLTLASTSQRTYANLQAALSLPTLLDLEHLVTDAIYAGLLTGTLNPAQQTVVISSVAPLRDLAPGSVAAMVAELEAWSQRCEGVLQELEADMARVRTDAVKRARRKTETVKQEQRAEEAAEAAAKGGKAGMGMRGGGGKIDLTDTTGDDAMDVDGGGGGGRGTRSKGLFGRKR